MELLLEQTQSEYLFNDKNKEKFNAEKLINDFENLAYEGSYILLVFKSHILYTKY